MAQVLLSMHLNLFYTIFILAWKPLSDPREMTIEVINELVTLVTIILISGLLGSMTTIPVLRLSIAGTLIGLTSFNLCFGILPILWETRKPLW